MQFNKQARLLGFALLGLALAFIIPGAIYWIAFRANVPRCLYWDPSCSLAISTYLLCALTASVFVATFFGALYAKGAFDQERRAILSLEQCRSSCERHKTFYVDNAMRGFNIDRPLHFKEQDYGQVQFDCISVGRSPVINGVLGLIVDDGKYELKLSVGSLISSSERHFIVWFAKEFTNLKLHWNKTMHS